MNALSVFAIGFCVGIFAGIPLTCWLAGYFDDAKSKRTEDPITVPD